MGLYLCEVYLELTVQLGSARVRCNVGNKVVNHKLFDHLCV